VRASAPGKVVLSGAYSVLEGAPAIVSAVNRYVRCDSAHPSTLVTPEVRAALPSGPVPSFDASELRAGERKLGLGSSAAILVGSLAAAWGASFAEEKPLRQAIYASALRAHREAQRGGSGIDVAASTWGGTLIARREGAERLEAMNVELPTSLVVQAWASSTSASTPELLARVARLREGDPHGYEAIMKRLFGAARDAADAMVQGDIGALISALDFQRHALARLGDSASVPIVTRAVSQLADWAATRGAVVLPSGAGGGDIVLWVSTGPAPPEFHALAARLEHQHVPLALDARGVFCTPAESENRGS
jgi:phosphomevalonate kinase